MGNEFSAKVKLLVVQLFRFQYGQKISFLDDGIFLTMLYNSSLSPSDYCI